MSKKTQRTLMFTALILVLAMASVLVYELVYARLGRRIELPPLYGRASASEEYDPDLLAPGILKIVDDKLSAALAVDADTSARLIASSYETPAARGEEGQRSESFLAPDQLAYGRTLARMGKRSLFLKWMESFDRAYKAGFFHADQPGGEGHWSVTLAYVRSLLEGYQAFGGKKIEKKIAELSALLLPLFSAGETAGDLIAGPKTLVAYDEWDVPPPGTLPTPGEEQPLVRVRGTYLADIDLWALYALSRFDPGWGPLARTWQQTLEGARLTGELPLYASAIDEEGNYLAVTGDSLLSRTGEELTIALHLAEAGFPDYEFASLIRSGLRDDKRLPAGWNPVTGGEASSYAQSSAYALSLSLGRALGDPLLINAAREVMMTFYASSSTSDIFGGWYRPGSTDRSYILNAEDNLAVLLSLR